MPFVRNAEDFEDWFRFFLTSFYGQPYLELALINAENEAEAAAETTETASESTETTTETPEEGTV